MLVSLVVACASTAMLAWLTLELLAQDEAAERQARRERLENFLTSHTSRRSSSVLRSLPAQADSPQCRTYHGRDHLDELSQAIAELAARLHAATYELLILIREFDAQEGCNTGFLSCAHWLHWRTGIDLGAAREKVRVARALAAFRYQVILHVDSAWHRTVRLPVPTMARPSLNCRTPASTFPRKRRGAWSAIRRSWSCSTAPTAHC